jgi:hypothetical protein
MIPQKGNGALPAPIPKLLIQSPQSTATCAFPQGCTLVTRPDLSVWERHAAHTKRLCAGCGVPVNNGNLGGHARSSALAGRLWCLRCADELERRRT